MRQRIKSTTVYHAEPEQSKCFLMKHEVLSNKLKKGTITKDELMQLAAFRAKHSIKPKRQQYFVPCFGSFIEVSKEMYDRYYAK